MPHLHHTDTTYDHTALSMVVSLFRQLGQNLVQSCCIVDYSSELFPPRTDVRQVGTKEGAHYFIYDTEDAAVHTYPVVFTADVVLPYSRLQQQG